MRVALGRDRRRSPFACAQGLPPLGTRDEVDSDHLEFTFVGSAEENGVFTIGLADDEHDASEYLLFQQWIDPDEAELDSAVYIERNGQQYGTYGGLVAAVLGWSALRLSLTPGAANALGTAMAIEVAFPAELHDKLEEGLRRVLGQLLVVEPQGQRASHR